MASRLILRRGRSLVASALSGARHARLVAPAQSSAPAAALRLASSSAGGEHSHVEPRTHEEQTEWVKKELGEEWDSYGFAPHDKKADRFDAHLTHFVMVFVMLVPVWIWYYIPDVRFEDWSHREAFLLLRERESKGEEPISRDLIPAERVELPSDEELGDTAVMI